jgi:hypothetical protein
MTFNKVLSIALVLFLFMTSCEKEALEKSTTESLIESESTEKPTETAAQVTERMRLKTIEFLELIGEPIPRELYSSTALNSRSPYYAYNSGRMSSGYPSLPNNTSDPLNFGTRRGTTQWISFTLDNSYISAPQNSSGYSDGSLNFNLNGVGQRIVHFLIQNTVSFNFAIDLATQTAVITPTTNASLHSRQVPNTSFTLDNPLSVTIHSNTNGWMSVQVNNGGTVVFSSLYRYTYETGFDTRNGGTVYTRGFSGLRPGPLPPYAPAGFTTNYTGYCGWF